MGGCGREAFGKIRSVEGRERERDWQKGYWRSFSKTKKVKVQNKDSEIGDKIVKDGGKDRCVK